MIDRLQVSDLHLGDCKSLFASPEFTDHVVDQISTLSQGEIRCLIVAGDAHEECVPDDMTKLADGVAWSVADASRRFFGALFARVRVREVVVVPGNHDLATWVFYRKTKGHPATTPYTGQVVPRGDWPWSVLYPGCPVDPLFAYPLYWDCSRGDGHMENGDYPLHVVTHGHLLDPLVIGADSAPTYDFLWSLGCRRPSFSWDEGLPSIRKLGEATLDFCLNLWKRYSTIDYAYSNYVMRRLNHPESCPFMLSGDVPMGGDEHPAGQGNASNLPWFLAGVVMDPDLPTPVGSLGQGGSLPPVLTEPSCLSFGHDHLGIFRQVVACGVPFVAADSGGWTAEFRGHRPHTHVLVWRGKDDVVPVPHVIR